MTNRFPLTDKSGGRGEWFLELGGEVTND